MNELSLYKVSSGSTNEGKSYAGAEWYLKYETTKASAGKTLVKWYLYKRGRTTTPTFLSTTIELYFTSDYTITYQSGTKLTWKPERITADPSPRTGIHRSYNPGDNSSPTASGSFIITHNNSGQGSFYVQLNAAIYTSSITKGKKQTVTLKENKPQSNCYWSPTTGKVTIDKTIATPGGEITVTWAGAVAGISNAIKGFRVDYALSTSSGEKVWKTAKDDIEPTKTSYNFILPSEDTNRGKYVTVRVFVKNTITTFEDGSLWSSNQCKINSKPSAPILTTKSQIVPSTQSTIKFDITPGKDVDGQACSIYYSGTDGVLKLYTTGTAISLSSGTNQIWFCTFDGLEYSDDNVSITITRNSKPTVAMKIDDLGSFKRQITVTPTSGQSGNDEYNCGFSFDNVNYTIWPKTKDRILRSGDMRIGLYNKVGPFIQGRTYSIKFWIQRYDGVEKSDIYYSEQEYFTVPNFYVSGKAIGDNNDIHKFFEKEVYVKLQDNQNDTDGWSTDARDIEGCSRGEQLKAVSFPSSDGRQFEVALSSDQYLTRVKEIIFNNIELSNVNSTTGYFNPYTSPVLGVSMSALDGSYGLSEPPGLEVRHLVGTDWITCGPILPSASSSDNTWYYELTPAHLWGNGRIATSVVNTVDYISKAEKKIKLELTSEFEKTFTKDYTLFFDFSTAPYIDGFQVDSYSSDLKQGSSLKFKGIIKYYSNKLDFNIIDTASKNSLVTVTRTKEYYNTDPWVSNEGGWSKNPYEYDLSNITEKTIGAIKTTYETTFEITASTDLQAIASSGRFKLWRHTAPRINLTQLSHSGNVLSGQYDVVDFGSDHDGVLLKFDVVDEKDRTIAGGLTHGDGSFEVEFEFNDEAYLFFTLKFYSTLKIGGAESTYDSRSNSLVVYNILPTISYRENSIGINTRDPHLNGSYELPDAAVTISQHSTQTKVYLVSGLNTASIDLENGAQNGFILDCGSWDNTPGGIIPSSPELPANLARIAYSGNIKDLEQSSDIIVVLSSLEI